VTIGDEAEILNEIDQLSKDLNVVSIDPSADKGGVYVELFVYDNTLPKLVKLLQDQMNE
jgi:hypothetical protein